MGRITTLFIEKATKMAAHLERRRRRADKFFGKPRNAKTLYVRTGHVTLGIGI
jgi:hypothetical protein